MNAKLPVGDTISFIMRFAATNIGLLLRVAWLPVVASLAGSALIFGAFGLTDLAALQDDAMPAEPDAELMALGYLLSFVGMLLFVPGFVIVTRKAAGGYAPPRGPFAGFRFGGRELRVIGAAILWYLLFVAFYIAAVLVFAVLGGGFFALAMSGESAMIGMGLVMVIAMLALFGGLIFLFVRTMLFVPMAAVENRIALGDAWRATRGNFWRLLAVGLVLYAALTGIYLVFAIIGVALFGIGGEAALAPGIAVLSLLAIPAYLFAYPLFLAFPGRAIAALRPMREDQAAAVFD